MENELVVDTYKTALTYISNLKSAISVSTQYLQTGKENLAFEILKEITEALDWLMQVKNLSASIDTRYNINIADSVFLEVISQINDSIGNIDYVAIADSLEYELKPQIEIYEKELERVLGECSCLID